jgi:hypothetical protein
MSHHQNAGQNHNTKTANRSFENVAVQIFGNQQIKTELINKLRAD